MSNKSYTYLVAIGLLVFSGCQTIQFENPNIVSENDWLVDGKAQNRSRSTSEMLSLPMEMAWEYNAAGAFGPGSPLILNGTVLVGTGKGEIHAVELESGRKAGYKGFSEGIEGTPVIDSGRLFIPSTLGKSALMAFDLKKGSVIWKKKGVAIESGPVLYDGLIITADIQGGVRAYDESTGKERWHVELGERVSVLSSLLLVGEGSVLVADDSGRAHLLSASTGEQRWMSTLSGPVYEGMSSLGNMVVIPTTRGTLEALLVSDGSSLWTYKIAGNVRLGSAAVSEKMVVVGATDGKVRALDPSTGAEIWTVQLPDVIVAAPLVTQESVFIGSMGNGLFALSTRDGQVQWDTELKGRVKSAMAIVGGGLLVLSEPRYVSFFKPVEEKQ